MSECRCACSSARVCVRGWLAGWCAYVCVWVGRNDMRLTEMHINHTEEVKNWKYNLSEIEQSHIRLMNSQCLGDKQEIVGKLD